MPKKDFEKVMKDYADYEIDKIRVVRRPLKGGKPLEFIKNHLLNKGTPHDKVYHLYTEFAVKDPKTGKQNVILVEKFATLNAQAGQSGGLIDDSFEGTNIPVDVEGKKPKMTMGSFFKAGKAEHDRIGMPFYRYSLRHANCQNFSRVNLQANGLLTDEVQSFIEQPAPEIVPPYLGAISNAITDITRIGSDIKDRLTGKKGMTETAVESVPEPVSSGTPTASSTVPITALTSIIHHMREGALRM